MTKNRQQITELSQELARIAGLRLRVPKPEDPGYIAPGFLRSLIPEEYFQWWKCPFHSTWLQPVFEPHDHWACMAKDFCKKMHEVGRVSGSTRIVCKGHACTFKRAAKMRTQIEKRIFRVARFLQEHA